MLGFTVPVSPRPVAARRQLPVVPARASSVLLALTCRLALAFLAPGCAATFADRPPANAGLESTNRLAFDSPDGWTGIETAELGDGENRFNGLVRYHASAQDSPAGSGQDESPGAPAGTPDPDPAPPVRVMVYTAQLGVLVSSFEEARDALLAEVKRRGGYLEEQTGSVVVVRVPARDFDACLDFARGLGRVLDESIRAQDVTREYHDLGIRIENAEETRKRLLALYEKAEDPEAIRGILEHLHRVTEELERLKGELRYLSEQVAYSRIGVELKQNAPPVRIGNRRQSRFWWVNELGLEAILSRF